MVIDPSSQAAPEDDVKKFDVAISFLAADMSIAKQLEAKLAEGLRTFLFPRNQEELAGTDGMESMREPFRYQSRLNVVLFRSPWGHTPWTRIEQTAITERCLHDGWQTLLFVVLAPDDELPKWLPDTHVRLDLTQYGIEQAVGAIKARVEQLGGAVRAETLADRAERYGREADYERRRKNYRETYDAIHAAEQAFEALKSAISKLLNEVGPKLSNQPTIKADGDGAMILLGLGQPLKLIWKRRYANSLDESALVVERWDGHPPMSRGWQIEEPRRLSKEEYQFGLAPSGEGQWFRRRQPRDFFSSEALAELLLREQLDTAAR